MTLDPQFVVGILLLLSGWMVLPLAVKILTLAIGGALGFLLVDLSCLLFEDFYPKIWLYLISAGLFGIIGLFFAKRLFKVLLFAAGFIATLVLKLRADELYGLSDQLNTLGWGEFFTEEWFTLVVGIVGGLLLTFLRKYLIILLTALAGAGLVVGNTSHEGKWVTLASLGGAFQILCTSAFPGKKKRRLKQPE